MLRSFISLAIRASEIYIILAKSLSFLISVYLVKFLKLVWIAKETYTVILSEVLVPPKSNAT